MKLSRTNQMPIDESAISAKAIGMPMATPTTSPTSDMIAICTGVSAAEALVKKNSATATKNKTMGTKSRLTEGCAGSRADDCQRNS